MANTAQVSENDQSKDEKRNTKPAPPRLVTPDVLPCSKELRAAERIPNLPPGLSRDTHTSAVRSIERDAHFIRNGIDALKEVEVHVDYRNLSLSIAEKLRTMQGSVSFMANAATIGNHTALKQIAEKLQVALTDLKIEAKQAVQAEIRSARFEKLQKYLATIFAESSSALFPPNERREEAHIKQFAELKSSTTSKIGVATNAAAVEAASNDYVSGLSGLGNKTILDELGVKNTRALEVLNEGAKDVFRKGEELIAQFDHIVSLGRGVGCYGSLKADKVIDHAKVTITFEGYHDGCGVTIVRDGIAPSLRALRSRNSVENLDSDSRKPTASPWESLKEMGRLLRSASVKLWDLPGLRTVHGIVVGGGTGFIGKTDKDAFKQELKVRFPADQINSKEVEERVQKFADLLKTPDGMTMVFGKHGGARRVIGTEDCHISFDQNGPLYRFLHSPSESGMQPGTLTKPSLVEVKNADLGGETFTPLLDINGAHFTNIFASKKSGGITIEAESESKVEPSVLIRNSTIQFRGFALSEDHSVVQGRSAVSFE